MTCRTLGSGRPTEYSSTRSRRQAGALYRCLEAARRPVSRASFASCTCAAGATHVGQFDALAAAPAACGWRVGSTSSHNRSNTSSSCSAPGCAGGGWPWSRATLVWVPSKRSSSFEPPARGSEIPSSLGPASSCPKCPANVPSGSGGGGHGPEPVIEQERERSVLLDFRT